MSEEDEADDRVEAAADDGHLDVPDVVVDHDEREGAEPRPLDAAEAADHGDHEQLDRRAEPDVRRRDLPVPPDEEHAGERRDEGGEPERERAVERDVVAERGHPHGSSRTPWSESPNGVRTR